MELPKECLQRACYSCPFHKRCLIEKQLEEDLNTDTIKYYKALLIQQCKDEN